MPPLSTKAKEAIKTGLALVIAYAIPLRLGWDDPFWVPLTLVTVNMMTTGQSLPRSMLRCSGTLLGGVAALAILGLYPQDRWGFMILLSLFVGFCTYRMKGTNAYFWFLAALTCLVIPFKSMPLESQTAFEMTWLRTVETATGALVWILVSAFVWPRSSLGPFEEVTRKLSAVQSELFRRYRDLGSGRGTVEESRPLRLEQVQLLAQAGKLLDAAESDSYEVWGAHHPWQRFFRQSKELMEALERWRHSLPEVQPLDLARLLPNLDAVYSELHLRLQQVERILAGEAPTRAADPMTLAVDRAALRALTRFEEAAVIVTKGQLDALEALSRSLLESVAEIRGHAGRTAEPAAVRTAPGRLALDRDRLGAVASVLATLWIAFFLWLYINPPMGAGFVMMATIFALIMQLAPAADASTQSLAWGAGGAFAGVLYVFVMPHLSGYPELAILLFAASFVMYYLLGEPRQTLARMLCMASFFILLQIDNQQSYSFSQYVTMAMGLIILPLGVVSAVVYLPPSPRPEKMFLRLVRRFFRNAERAIAGRTSFFRNDLLEIPDKLAACGQQIDHRACPANSPEQVHALVTSLYALANRIGDLVEARGAPQAEPVEQRLRADLQDWHGVLEGRFQRRADQTAQSIETGEDWGERLAARLARLEDRVNEVFAEADEGELSSQDLANFYRLLGSYRGLAEAGVGYGRLADTIDWAQWREPRF